MGLQYRLLPTRFSGMTELTPRLYWSILAVVAIALMLPVVLIDIPPLYDYAGHLARIVTTWRLLHGTEVTGNFALQPAIVPNLGMDAVVLALMWLGLPAEVAGRVFLGATLLMIGGGTLLLHQALFRRRSLVPVLACAFLYCDTLLWGFMSYLFGVGLVLIGAAVWLRLRDRPQAAGAWLAVFAVAAFFCHLLAALLLFGVVIGLEVWHIAAGGQRGWSTGSWRGLAATFWAMIPAGVLLLLAPVINQGRPPPTNAFSSLLSLDAVLLRIREFSYFTIGYDEQLDKAALMICITVLVMLAIMRRLAVAWALVLPLAGLALIYLLVPDGWVGTEKLPERLPLAIFCLALASVEARRGQGGIAALAVALVVVRVVTVLPAWQAAEVEAAPLLAAISRLRPSDRIYYAVIYDRPFRAELRPPVGYLANYATIRAGSYSNGVHALPKQNILVRAGSALRIPADPGTYRVGSPYMLFRPPFLSSMIASYDYVLVVNPDLYPAPPPDSELLVRTPRAALYNLRHRSP